MAAVESRARTGGQQALQRRLNCKDGLTSSTRRSRARAALAPLFCAAFLSVATLSAAPPPATPTPTSPGSFPVRERVFYVPFEKLEELFATTGRGIFLPYEEFLDLWQRANPDVDPPAIEPPAAAVLRGGSFQGEVEDGIARLTATYSVEALRTGWSELPLSFPGAAIESVELSDPAALLAAGPEGTRLLLPRAGSYTATIRLAVKVQREPGRKQLQLGIPVTGVSRLDLTIPEANARVEVEPGLAATQTITEAGATRVLAFLGRADSVTVRWTPPAGLASEEGAIVSARQWIRATLGERILRLTTFVRYDLQRGEVDRFRVRVPDDLRVIAVKADNLRQWRIEDGVLVLELHAPVRDTYDVELRFERLLETTPEQLTVPFPRGEGLHQELGWLLLESDDNLTVRITEARNLSQLDPDEVPEAYGETRGTGFLYLAQPISLALAIERITPELRASSVSVVALDREEDRWVGWIDYEILRAGVFRLRFQVPTAWRVDSVGTPETVEEFQTEDSGALRTITASLRARARGNFRLPFRLLRDGSVQAATQTLAPPRVLDARQDRGLFGVSAPRAWEVITVERTGSLQDADGDELLRAGILSQVSADAQLPRAYRYRDQPAGVSLRLEPRKTELEVLAQHLIEVTDSELRSTHILQYQVLFAPVDRLRFRAPSTLDDALQVEAQQKTQVQRLATVDGITTWEVELQPPVLGPLIITVRHSEDLAALEAGQRLPVTVALVRPVDARAERGFVALRKEGTLEVSPTTTGMETIDPTDLPDVLRRRQVYGAFRYFTADPTLALELTRYDLQRLASTVVTLLHLHAQVTEERQLRTRATLYVQNADRQFLELRLAPGARITALAVNGQRQSEKKGRDDTATLIEIPPSAAPGGTFPVVVEYEEPLGGGELGSFGSLVLSTPALPDDVPVTRIELALFLPPEYAYFGWDGTLHARSPYAPSLWERFRGLPPALHVPPAPGERTRLGADLATEGFRRFDFDSLAPRGRLQFSYLGWRLYWFLDFLLCAAAALGTALAMTRGWPQHRLAVGLVLLGAAFALCSFTTGPVAGFYGSLLLGVALTCAFFLWRAARRSWQTRRTARGSARSWRRTPSLALDPFIEEAPHPHDTDEERDAHTGEEDR